MSNIKNKVNYGEIKVYDKEDRFSSVCADRYNLVLREN